MNVPIQEVQEYWDSRPCNIRHSAKQIGTREYFDEVEARKYKVEPHIPGFAAFPEWRGKSVLEIGCGIGTDTINFARHGARVVAVDVSEASLAVAKQRAGIFGLDRAISFVHGDAEHLDQIVPRQQFDLVYSFGVIHHTPHPEKVVDQVRRVMHDDSEFRAMVYSRASYKAFWIMHEEQAWDMGRLDELISRNSEAQTGCPVTYSYTFAGARRLLRGFRLLEMRKAHIFTWDIDSYKKYEFKRDAAWEGVPESEIQELEAELGWHLLLRARRQ